MMTSNAANQPIPAPEMGAGDARGVFLGAASAGNFSSVTTPGADNNDADPLAINAIQCAVRGLDEQACVMDEKARHVLATADVSDDAARNEACAALADATRIRGTVNHITSALGGKKAISQQLLGVFNTAIQTGSRAAALEITHLACVMTEAKEHRAAEVAQHDTYVASHVSAPATVPAKAVARAAVAAVPPVAAVTAAAKPSIAARAEHWLHGAKESAKGMVAQANEKAASVWSATMGAASSLKSAVTDAYKVTARHMNDAYDGMVDHVSETTIPYWVDKGTVVVVFVDTTLESTKTTARNAYASTHSFIESTIDDAARNAAYAMRETKEAMATRLAALWPRDKPTIVVAAKKEDAPPAKAPAPAAKAVTENPGMLDAAGKKAKDVFAKLSGSVHDVAADWFNVSPSTPKITAVSSAVAKPS